jgi:hemoglobin-like flavoprotein
MKSALNALRDPFHGPASSSATISLPHRYAMFGWQHQKGSAAPRPLVDIMTLEQVDLIRHSFDAIWPIRRKLAGRFYSRFFELAPDAKRLFPSDMERQHLKLMDMIAAIVGALDKREIFQSIIRHTGRQHAQFGVNPSHFVAFGDALIWSLEKQFGAAFTPKLKEAWIELYRNVQSEMLRVAI